MIKRFISKDIQVIDNLIPDSIRNDVWECIKLNNETTGWKFGAFSTMEFMEEQFWKMKIYRSSNIQSIMNLFDFINSKKFGGRLEIELIEENKGDNMSYPNIYINGQTANQEGTIHQDNVDENALTILYYPILLNHDPSNYFWDIHWGGETLFYNDKKDEIIKSVLPKPNRLVIFPGSIPHRASAPTKYMGSDQLRISLAFKCFVKT